MENDDENPSGTIEDSRDVEQLADIHRYVRYKEYPPGLSKDQKRRIREKAACFSEHDQYQKRKALYTYLKHADGVHT